MPSATFAAFESPMQIDYLADREEHLDTLAEWQQLEFGYLNTIG